jgi:long-chain acyl-CoA synthetase
VFEDVHELAPDYIVLDPPLLETLEKGIGRRLGFHETVLVRFEKFYQVFSGFIMGRYPRFRREERLLEIFAALPPLLILSPVKVISRFILRGRVRRLLGGRLKAVICGGGPLPAWLDRFFAALGVRVLEAYGLTEASPVVSMRAESAPVLGTVGRPLPSTEVRIAGENGQSQPAGRKGSLLVRGPQVMLGYSRDPEATRRVLSPDGWLTTGDTGLLTVDGNLVITGRARDVISMKSGERVEPGPIELVIQESPYVQQAVIVGDGRDSLGLLVVPQAEALRQWALARKIPPADTRSLVGNPVVYRFYQEEVQARLVNGGVTLPGGRAPRIALLPAPFEVGRELTRTLSKRREAIAELYGPVIDRLYLP